MARDDSRKPFRPGGKGGGGRGPGRGPVGGGGRGGRPMRGPARPPRLAVNGRDAALRLLRQQVRKFPDLELTSPTTDGLDNREAAFAHALYDVLLRRWLTLRSLLEPRLNEPWFKIRPEALAGLMGGLAELLFMRSVPAHAAIHESVEWTKAHGGQGAGNLVNAVLRRIQREMLAAPVPVPSRPAVPPGILDDDEPKVEPVVEPVTDERRLLPDSNGAMIELSEPVLPSDPVERLVVTSSTPRELLNVWSRSLPLDEVRRIALHGLVSPPVILNVSFAKLALPEEVVTPHNLPGHAVFTGGMDELRRILSNRTDVWVQDPASTLAVESVSDLTPDLVIDLCAGLGTKTRQLAHMFPGARIVATDVDKVRYRVLEEVFAGHERVEVVPFESIRERYLESADLVLLDVPCSNTGVLARRVEARYRYSTRRREELVGLQRQIMVEAIPLLTRSGGSGGGKILYSTCSLDPEENQAQAKWASRWHHFRVGREHVRRPTGGPGEPATAYSDGSYAVLLEP